jgi:hypothetical protein
MTTEVMSSSILAPPINQIFYALRMLEIVLYQFYKR